MTVYKGPEALDRSGLRDRLVDYAGYMDRTYGEQIEKFHKAGKISRWLIGRRYPQVKNYVEFRDAQQSISDAIRHAAAHEGNVIIP
jgi:hypothetical protein